MVYIGLRIVFFLNEIRLRENTADFLGIRGRLMVQRDQKNTKKEM